MAKRTENNLPQCQIVTLSSRYFSPALVNLEACHKNPPASEANFRDASKVTIACLAEGHEPPITIADDFVRALLELLLDKSQQVLLVHACRMVHVGINLMGKDAGEPVVNTSPQDGLTQASKQRELIRTRTKRQGDDVQWRSNFHSSRQAERCNQIVVVALFFFASAVHSPCTPF